MTTATAETVRQVIERLVGQKSSLDTAVPDTVLRLLSDSGGLGLGYSQLNELLILLGFDRVTHSFFQYIATGETEYQVGSSINSLEALEQGIDRFRKVGLLLFGNVKYAFKTLSRDADLLAEEVLRLSPLDLTHFESRHDPVRPILSISGQDTYYLGYLVEREIAERLQKDPEDPVAKEEERRRQEIISIGKENHEAYLASDHLDVYVATSMRARHEFVAVSRLTNEIFCHPEVAPLKLRWFDPTQAYCRGRIDKGLAEALMLRRAQCTIYFAQETDTLGKDSELASTLAQGKPVIAFVPEVDSNYAKRLLEDLGTAYPDKDERDILLEQLRIFDPASAWNDVTVKAWIADPTSMEMEEATALLQNRINDHYDRRSATLKESHPLGIQVNLATGVANGVLVVRTVEQCAQLVRSIITRTLKFKVEEVTGYTLLREEISGCIFRVMTADMMLTNAFWNFYLEPSE